MKRNQILRQRKTDCINRNFSLLIVQLKRISHIGLIHVILAAKFDLHLHWVGGVGGGVEDTASPIPMQPYAIGPHPLERSSTDQLVHRSAADIRDEREEFCKLSALDPINSVASSGIKSLTPMSVCKVS